MPDLGELLRWSIENSTPPQTQPQNPAPDSSSTPLSLSFKPTTQPSTANSTLHPSDPNYPTDHLSPASTPGPATPTNGSSSLPTIPARRTDLTSEMLDLIMGKGDSVYMKEKMTFAVDEENDEDQRVEALDDFEMLIELLDNANNMAVLKLWQPLLGLLRDPSPRIVAQALWIMGTAVQNNPKAQAALYIFKAFTPILEHIHPSSSTTNSTSQTRAKATYALSSALKHWPLASSALSSNSSQGYKTLKQGVVDSDVVVRRKMAFLVGTLVMQSEEKYEGEVPNEVRNLVEESTKDGVVEGSLVEGLKREGVFGGLIQGLSEGGDGDLEFEENAIRASSQAAEKNGLSEEERLQVKGIWERWGSSGQVERGFEGEDAREISRILA